jgi:hypothetical protein
VKVKLEVAVAAVETGIETPVVAEEEEAGAE